MKTEHPCDVYKHLEVEPRRCLPNPVPMPWIWRHYETLQTASYSGCPLCIELCLTKESCTGGADRKQALCISSRLLHDHPLQLTCDPWQSHQHSYWHWMARPWEGSPWGFRAVSYSSELETMAESQEPHSVYISFSRWFTGVCYYSCDSACNLNKLPVLHASWATTGISMAFKTQKDRCCATYIPLPFYFPTANIHFRCRSCRHLDISVLVYSKTGDSCLAALYSCYCERNSGVVPCLQYTCRWKSNEGWQESGRTVHCMMWIGCPLYAHCSMPKRFRDCLEVGSVIDHRSHQCY